jgi:K+-transporting ATPase ATPase B chain
MEHSHNLVLDKKMFKEAIIDAFKMLDPRIQFKNPVMFVTYLGTIVTTLYLIHAIITNQATAFNIQMTMWLWFTILFANFAQGLAESKGKAHAASLKKAQTETLARQIQNGVEIKTAPGDLKKGDLIICEAGDIIAADGEIIQGIATVDESAITGESAPVIRESGGDRSAVTAGTKVLSDRLMIRVTSQVGDSFLDRMINLIEGAKRQKTPNELSLYILLSGLTFLFLLTVASLKAFASFNQDSSSITIPDLIALLICLIPTTVSALLSAVGIAGIDRLVRRNVIAKSGRSVEAAGDIDLLILDKTGTITIGNRMATAFLPVVHVAEKDFAEIAQLASLSDETPEGRSIVVLAKTAFSLRAESLDTKHSSVIPFSAKTRMSGIDLLNDKGEIVRCIRKGSPEAIREHIEAKNGEYPEAITQMIQNISKSGGTPLLVSNNEKVVGIIHLKDVVKGGIKERFKEMRKMGIRTIMVTGDNPLTAAAIAAEAGVDDFIAEATPEIKLALIKSEQEKGHLVAMTGDGTNDAPALAQADVAVALNTGTQASRDAGNMVDLDSNPTKLIEIVEIGKQLLMTRGALTTFSIANDVGKYFAIIPAIFSSLYVVGNEQTGPLGHLNIMHLHSPKSAILSAIIFNALVIIALIPLALKGVKYEAKSADDLLKKNIIIYGFGGFSAPFIGIKLIDLIVPYLI